MNNYSKQRQIILDTLKNTKIHPTAEQIYEMVLKVDPKISRSTVYRNINILCENNQILKISMLVGPDRYDYIWKKHYHAICEMCGNVWDFNFEFNEEEMSKQIESQTGVLPKMDSLTIYGICENCKSKIGEE